MKSLLCDPTPLAYKVGFHTPEQTRATWQSATGCIQNRLIVWTAISDFLDRQSSTGHMPPQVLVALRNVATQRSTLVTLGRAGYSVLPIRAVLQRLSQPDTV